MVLMHPIGVHSHLYRGAPEVVADTLRAAGLTCVQLTPNFPGLAFNDLDEITPERCRLAAAPFLALGIEIAALSSNVRLLEPDLDQRHRGVMRWHRLIRHCRDFGTSSLTVESGRPPETSEGWHELCRILEEGLRLAEAARIQLLVKASLGQALAGYADLLRLREAVPHPCLAFVFDPACWLAQTAPERRDTELLEAASRLGPYAPLMHAKDLRVDERGVALPRAGSGALDYGRILQLLKRVQPAAPIILDHVRPHEVAATRRWLEELQMKT